jgi:hypothetical protein
LSGDKTLNISSGGGAVEFGLLTGIGYLVANTVNIAVNPNIPKPILYGLISGAFHLFIFYFFQRSDGTLYTIIRLCVNIFVMGVSFNLHFSDEYYFDNDEMN